jgi:hypothetical protein
MTGIEENIFLDNSGSSLQQLNIQGNNSNSLENLNNNLELRGLSLDNPSLESFGLDTNQATDSFQVTELNPTANGFTIKFNRELNAKSVNLYDGQDVSNDLADLTVVGKTQGEIKGSLVWNGEQQILTFLKTGGILAPDDYTVTLVVNDDGIADINGNLLDGDANGTAGGNYTQEFQVTATDARVIGLSDLVRGPAQPIDTTGLPITINNAENITQASFDLVYDPELLFINDVKLGENLPEDWEIDFDLTTPGKVSILLSGSALTEGSLDLVSLTAVVPGSAEIGASQVLSLENLDIKAGETDLEVINDAALHQVGYIGDVNGDGEYRDLDAHLISRLAVQLDTGFDAYENTDPNLIASVGNTERLSALEASFAARKARNLATDIPDLPANIKSASIREASPTNGEEMVSLTREAVIRFSEAVDPETISEDAIKVYSLGKEVSGRLVISSTEKFVTFFPDEPWNASSEVRVEIDGSKILGRDGQPFDADGDSEYGGIATVDFTTSPITQIEGTNVTGYVYDSFNQDADGNDIPIVGATIRVDALPNVFAVTDENGFFKLENVPAPEFSVHIDGSTATNAPDGTTYATVGKLFHSVPGQEVHLTMNGEEFDIYLPPMALGDIQQLNSDKETEVGFGEAGKAELAEILPDIDPEVWDAVKVTFPPGSAIDEQGNPATQATIIPVDPKRIPAPLPPGLDLPLVISIQAGGEDGFSQSGGATNFDVPAPAQFPNLDNLAPGEKSLIWSFNHDSGKWEVIGTGTVSEDGAVITSDEGVGILAPGWHGTAPGTPPEEPPKKPPCEDFGAKDAWKIGKTIFDCAKNMTRALQAIGSVFDVIDNMNDLRKDISDLRKGYGDGTLTLEEVKAAVGGLQKIKNSGVSAYEALTASNPISKAIDALACANSLVQTVNDLLCDRKDCQGAVYNFICDKIQPILKLANKLIEKTEDLDKTIRKAPMTALCLAFDSFLTGLDVGSPIATSSFSLTAKSLSATNSDTKSEDADVLAAMDLMLQDIDSFKEELQPAIELAQTLEETDTEIDDLQDNGLSPLLTDTRAYQNAYWRMTVGDFELRGQTSASGLLDLPVVSPEVAYRLEIYDPQFNVVAISEGTTAASGESTILNPFQVQNLDGTSDTDEEGLVDLAEQIIGTSINKSDTDNDGISDRAEIEQGLDPLGGLGFPTGIISSLPIAGEAKGVVVEGSAVNSDRTAYVATGSYGLAVVDASQFNNPIIMGQLELAGDATDVGVDSNLKIAAIASNSGGLHLVDVSDPMLPTRIDTLDINANKIEVADGLIYAGVDNSLQVIDLLTGELLQELPLSGSITDISREGTNLYTYDSANNFSIIDIANEGAASIVGSLNVYVASSDVGVFAANDLAYLAGSGLRTIDISDRTNPTLLGDAETFFTARDLGLNGSGLALVAAEDQGLGIYNVTDPTNTDAIVTQIDTPGFTQDVALASGIAYVADDASGLQVVNYLGFDNQGEAPTVSISTSVDIDTSKAGIQAIEGSILPIMPIVEDDVQVRNVELLVDGEVVSNDVSFPYDFRVVAPEITDETNSVEIQVRATDTGGNSSLSNILKVNLVEDTFAPEVVSTTPSEGGRKRNLEEIALRFNEPIDTEILNTSGLTLTYLGADGVVGGNDDATIAIESFRTRNFDRTLVVSVPEDILPGEYKFKLASDIISDLAGNSLAEAFNLNLTKRPFSVPLGLGETIKGTIFEPGEDEVYTFEGTAGQRLYFDGISNNADSSLDVKLVSPSGNDVDDFYYYYNNVASDRESFSLIETGTYQLVVEDYYGTGTGDFSFRLFDLDTAENLEFDTEIDGTLTTGTETDVYQFTGTKDQRLFFKDEGSQSNIYYRIYNSANQYVDSGSWSDREIVLPGNGTYFLALQGYNNEATNYSFTMVTPETTTTELTLGEKVNGNIAEVGEQDIYTFDGTVGQKLFFDGISGDSNLNVKLVSPSGEDILYYYSNVNSDRDPVTLLETGTYELVVDGYTDNLGDYSFQLLDLADATNLKFDTITTGSLEPGTEAQFYKFTGQGEQLLFLDDEGSQADGSYYLYDAATDSYIQSVNFKNNRLFTLPHNGTYYLGLRGYGDGDKINYSFQVVTPESSTSELTFGGTVSGTIAEAGEQDIYTFDGTVGQKILFDGISGNNNVNVSLISPSGETVISSRNVNYDTDPVTLLETGSYELIVNGYDSNIGSYSFRVLNLANATQLTFDTAISGSLNPGQTSKIYQFTGEAGRSISFTDEGSQAGGSYYLYDSGNNWIASSSFRSDFDVTLPYNGSYYLVLFGNSDSNINYRFQAAKGTIEPPETPETTALTLGNTTSGGISEADEIDIYTFVGTAGQRIYYDGLTGGSNINTSLTSPTGETVFYSTNSDSNRSPVTLSETGTYQLTVDGYSDNTGNYSFNLINLSDTTQLTLDTVVDATLDPGNQTDFYQFTGTAEQRFFLKDEGSESNAYYSIYDVNNQSLAYTSLGNNQEFTLPRDGTFYLAVEGYNDTKVNYSFQLITPETTTTELTLGETQNGEISEAGEQDIYTFKGAIGQKLYYDGLTGDGNVYITIASPTDKNIIYTYSGNSDSALLLLSENGTYQLTVDGYDDTTGDYGFKLLDLEDSEALALDTVIEDSLDPGNETRFYQFTGTAEQKLFLKDEGSESGAYFYLYDSQGKSVDFLSLSSSKGFNLPKNGTYYLAIDGYNDAKTNYSFQLVTAETSTTELTLGDTIEGNIAKPGSEVIYTFDGTAGQRLFFDGIAGDYEVEVNLISPSGVDVYYNLYNYLNDSQPFSLIETGTYQLVVSSDRFNKDYSFRLLDLANVSELDFDNTIDNSLDPAQKAHIYQFTAQKDQTFSLNDLGSEQGSNFTIYNPANEYVYSGNLGYDSEYDFVIPGNGTYFLVVSSFGNEKLNYSFEANLLI